MIWLRDTLPASGGGRRHRARRARWAFFYNHRHGIDPALIAGVREAAKQIFALPMEEKMNY